MRKYFTAILDLLNRILNATVPNLNTITANTLNSGLSETLRNQINQIWPTQTGQTTSYANGDDGFFQYGRLTNFTTLQSNNVFGNTNRFTDILGGQTYTQPYAIDHATGLGWSLTVQTSATWANAVAVYATYTQTVNGVTYSDFFLPNNAQLLSVANFSASTYYFAYSPFSNTTSTFFWSSTTVGNLTTYAHAMSNQLQSGAGAGRALIGGAKTGTEPYILCRKHF